jgi:hypothetical protein
MALRLRRRLVGDTLSAIANVQLLDVFVVLVCIAAPTLALESSSPVWTPGTRWPMIYQLTMPGFLLSLGAFFLRLSVRTNLLRHDLIWMVIVGCAVVVGEAFSLGHNQLQVEYSRNEKFIRDSLLRLVAEDLAIGHARPEQILLMLDDATRLRWRSSDILSPTIARVWLQREDVSFRLLPWASAPTPYWDSWWTVQFGPDSEGVRNAKVWGGTVLYDQISILQIKGGAAQRVLQLDQSSLAGWAAEWKRDRALALPPVEKSRLCPFLWTADQDILAPGWSGVERDIFGPFRRMLMRSAHFVLPVSCASPAVMRIAVVGSSAADEPNGYNLFANGLQLNYRSQTVNGNIILETILPANVLAARPIVDIGLSNKQFTPRAIAVRSIEMRRPPSL